MNDPADLDVIRSWVETAEHDLLAAEHGMPLCRRGLAEVICFHCQQATEKYLKALLLQQRIDFPKTHDLRSLLDLLPPPLAAAWAREKVVPLNRYAVEGRYPGPWEPISAEEATRALEMARAARETARSLLPPAVFPPKN